MLKKCTISANSVTNSTISFNIMFHDNERYGGFRTELVEFACFPECNCLMSSFLFTSCYNVMSSLTSILCLENRTTRSETLTKTRCWGVVSLFGRNSATFEIDVKCPNSSPQLNDKQILFIEDNPATTKAFYFNGHNYIRVY